MPLMSAGRAAGSRRINRLLAALVLIAFAAGFARVVSAPPPATLKVTAKPVASSSSGLLGQGFLPTPTGREAHASTLLALPGGRQLALWIDGNEGSRESVISRSIFDPRTQSWSAPTLAASPDQTAADLDLHIRKVGNAVAHRSSDGRVWLFYVSVSVGGWAGSALNLRWSRDEGRTWTAARRLITAPFLNLSTLVRHAPVEFEDGSIAVPVYHELLNMYSQLLRVDRDGRVLDLQRLSADLTTLQPQFILRSPDDMLVLMRNGGSTLPRHVIQSSSRDAGMSWTRGGPNALPNPGSPVTGLVLADGRTLLALNNASSRRRNLSLMVAPAGSNDWRVVKTLHDARGLPEGRINRVPFLALVERAARDGGADPATADRMAAFSAQTRCFADASCDVEYSYPFLSQGDDGAILLSYTWNRSYVRWLRFDPSWLDDSRLALTP